MVLHFFKIKSALSVLGTCVSVLSAWITNLVQCPTQDFKRELDCGTRWLPAAEERGWRLVEIQEQCTNNPLQMGGRMLNTCSDSNMKGWSKSFLFLCPLCCEKEQGKMHQCSEVWLPCLDVKSLLHIKRSLMMNLKSSLLFLNSGC